MSKGAASLGVIVLAAGFGSRFREETGAFKLLAPLQGKPLVRHVTEAALDAALGPVVVVTGHGARQVRAALAGLDVSFIDNADYASGMASSLKAGLRALQADCAGALICLGDMPGVGARVLRALAQAFVAAPGTQVVVPTFNGERGNPVLLARGIFSRLEKLSGDQGARKVIGALTHGVVELAVDDAHVLLDVDTPQALNALQARQTKKPD